MRVDAVIPWVDGSDSHWLQRRRLFSHVNEVNDNQDIRYRDYGLLPFVLKSIRIFTPWIDHIYLLTMDQRPDIDLSRLRVTLIDHRDFIPERYLPTFNSNVIEMNIFRIPNLSEHFILFNDDTLFNAPVKVEQYFHKNLICDSAGFKPIIPAYGGVAATEANDVAILNKYFSQRSFLKRNFTKAFNIKYGLKNNLVSTVVSLWPHFLGFNNYHLPTPFTKEEFRNLWVKEYDILDRASQKRFRSGDDISQWLVRYLRLASGDFYPISPKYGCYYDLNDDSVGEVIEDIKQRKHSVLCLNDAVTKNYDSIRDAIVSQLRESIGSVDKEKR